MTADGRGGFDGVLTTDVVPIRAWLDLRAESGLGFVNEATDFRAWLDVVAG